MRLVEVGGLLVFLGEGRAWGLKTSGPCEGLEQGKN